MEDENDIVKILNPKGFGKLFGFFRTKERRLVLTISYVADATG